MATSQRSLLVFLLSNVSTSFSLAEPAMTTSPSSNLRGISSCDFNAKVNHMIGALALLSIIMAAIVLYLYEKGRRLDAIAEQGHDTLMRNEYPKMIVDAHDEEDEYYWDFAKSKSKASWEDELPLMARLGEELQCEMAKLGTDKNDKAK